MTIDCNLLYKAIIDDKVLDTLAFTQLIQAAYYFTTINH